MNIYQSRQRAFRPRAVLQKKRKVFWLQFGLVALNLALWVFVLSLFTHLRSLQITAIKVSGAEAVSGYRLTQTVSRELSGAYLSIFSKKNIIIFPRLGIEAAILAQFPRVANVAVARSGLSAVSVNIAERHPKFLWCGNSRSVASGDCYLTDETGLAFALAPEFSGQSYLKYSNGETGDLISRTFKSAFNFRELTFFIESLKGAGIEVEEVISLSNGDLELYFKSGGKAILSSSQTLGRSFDNLISIWNDNNVNLKAIGAKLDYIDLRFGNKVFYKEK